MFLDGDAMRPLDFVVTEGLVSTIGLGRSGTVNALGDATVYGKGSAGHEAGVVNREIGNGPRRVRQECRSVPPVNE
jgi:hypothetical protein